jgi:hypothetical protein
MRGNWRALQSKQERASKPIQFEFSFPSKYADEHGDWN